MPICQVYMRCLTLKVETTNLNFKVKKTIDSGYSKLDLKNNQGLIAANPNNQDSLIIKKLTNVTYKDSLCCKQEVLIIFRKIDNIKENREVIAKKVKKMIIQKEDK